MLDRKIKAIARIERDVKNFFFVRLLYGFADEEKLQTVHEIEDSELKDKLIELSSNALTAFPCSYNFGTTISIYDPNSKHCYSAPYTAHEKIIAGTYHPMQEFQEINYLIRMISYTIEKNHMGEFYVQYKDKIMTEEEFYEFQKELSIYTV